MASGFGSVFGTFGARTAASAPTLPLPLRSRNRANDRIARQRPHQRTAADAVRAPRRHERAHVLRREPGQFGQRRLAAEMLRQKSQELPDVALVGLDGLGRHPPLGAEMAEPARHLGRHVAGDEGQFGVRLWVVLCLTRGRLSHPLPSPFLNRPESARPAAWPRRSSMSWCRSRSTTPIRIGCRASLSSSPATSSSVPLGAREAIGVVWADDVTIEPGLHNRMKDVELKLDYPPLKPELRKFVDWISDYTLSPRGMVLRMCLRMGDLGPGAREGRRPAGRAAAEAHDGGARARAATARRRHGAGQERGGARGRRVGRRHRRADRRGRAGDAGAAAGAGGAAARSRSRHAGVHRRAARRGRCACARPWRRAASR